MTNQADIAIELLNVSNSLINCSARQLPLRISLLLDHLRQLGIADRLWLLTTGFGPDASKDADCTWSSRGAAELPLPLHKAVRQRCKQRGLHGKLQLTPIAADDFPVHHIDFCHHTALLVTGPQAALVLGWKSADGDKEIIQEHGYTIANLMNAVVGRWQQERLRSQEGHSGAREQLNISGNQPMSSALRAAVASESEKSIIEDVLESNANEHGLWRALSLFEIINRGSEDIISIHDAKGHCLYVNDACIEILGFDPEELIGRSCHELIHPQNHDELDQNLAAVIDDGISKSFKCRVLDSRGFSRMMEVRGGVVLDKSQKFTEMVLIFRDMGDRYLLEENLRFSEHNLHTILESIPDAIWFKDQQGIILSANHGSRAVFGAEADELVGRAESDFMGIADVHRSNQYDEIVLNSGEGVSYRHFLGRGEGNETVWEIHKGPIFDQDGDITGICTQAHNASTEIDLQVKLVHAAGLVKQCEEHHDIGYWSYEQSSEAFQTNRTFCTICGKNTDTSLANLAAFLQLVDPSQQDSVLSAIHDAFDLQRPFCMDLALNADAHGSRAVRLSGTLMSNGPERPPCIKGILGRA